MPQRRHFGDSILSTEQSKPLTLNEAARYLDISTSYLYKLTSRQQIRHYKPGGKRVFFLEKDLREYQMRNPVEPVIG